MENQTNYEGFHYKIESSKNFDCTDVTISNSEGIELCRAHFPIYVSPEEINAHRLAWITTILSDRSTTITYSQEMRYLFENLS